MPEKNRNERKTMKEATEQELTRTIATYGDVGIGPDTVGWWVGNRRVTADVGKDGTPNKGAGEVSYGRKTYHGKLWMACEEAAERVADQTAASNLREYAAKFREVLQDAQRQLFELDKRNVGLRVR
jgi:hypothetical protein